MKNKDTKKGVRTITITTSPVGENDEYEQRMDNDGYEGEKAVPQFMRDLADAVSTAFVTYYSMEHGMELLKDAFVPQILRAYAREAAKEAVEKEKA